MSVSKEVQDFSSTSLAENNKALLEQFSKLVADSAEGIKQSSSSVLTNNYARSRRFNTRNRSPLSEKETRFSTNSLLSFRIV